MGFAADMKILYQLVLKPVRGKSHAERMESFYGGQAEAYDDFRRRLLHGREELWNQLPKEPGCVWVDMGGGTGANIENFGDDISKPSKIYVVDLSKSLLKVASDRFRQRGWDHVEAVEADATQYLPPGGFADVVTFSYSLTMIPDWFAAIENAWRMLRPGGHIGVVDFYVSRKYPSDDLKQHRWFTRTWWPTWFSADNVFPSPDHLPFLRNRFEQVYLDENRNRLPYMPFIKTPYYVFVGRKPAAESSADDASQN